MEALQNSKKAVSMLWVTAAIWGFAFVAQRAGMEHIGPFAFNGIRFALGSIALLLLMLILKRKYTVSFKLLGRGSLLGIVLFMAASLQQAGMVWTTAGKAGFITGLYVVFVPLIGVFIAQHIKRNAWAGTLIAVAGLFLLTVNEQLNIGKGDLLILVSAFFWAIHVQLINFLVRDTAPLPLSVIQFWTCAFLSMIVAAFAEPFTTEGIKGAAVPLLYGGLISVGVAYTLQVFAQRHVQPAYASIILSFETVFAVLGGWLILQETLSIRSIAGCILMFGGMWLVQRRGKEGCIGSKQ